MVSYQIDKKGRTIRTRCSGNVTLGDVIEHFRELEQDADCPDRLDVLLDLSETSSLPEVHQLEAVSDALGKMRERIRFETCAIVASNEALFGLMRIFEVVAQKRFRSTHVFRSAAQAEAWLQSQQDSAQP